MSILSKPFYDFLGFYFTQLFNNPLRTKAITSCVIASAGNLTSQYIAGNKVIDQNNLYAYALFGLLFGGTLPHYFYGWLDKIITEDASFPFLKKLILERLIYTPIYQAFALYMLGRFEGKSHERSIQHLQLLYVPILLASWKYLTVIQVLNFTVVPPMLRVLLLNLVGFIWVVYLANKRRRQEAKSK